MPYIELVKTVTVSNSDYMNKIEINDVILPLSHLFGILNHLVMF